MNDHPKLSGMRHLATLSVMLGMLHSPANAGPAMAASGLRCESRVQPAGIDTPAPRLSWQLRDPRRGARQTAWHMDRCGKLSGKISLPCGRRVATGGLWGCVSPEAGQTSNRLQEPKKKGPRNVNKACHYFC